MSNVKVTSLNGTKSTKIAIAIPPGKVTKVITGHYNQMSAIKHRECNYAINSLLETLDGFPSKPSNSLEAVELLEANKKYAAEASEAKKTLKLKYKEINDYNMKVKKIRMKAKDMTDLSDEEKLAITGYQKLIEGLEAGCTKTQLQIFKIWDQKKESTKGNIRVGKQVPDLIAHFLSEVVYEMLQNGIDNLNKLGMKVMHNKHILSNPEDNKFFSFYQNLPYFASHRKVALLEIENDVSQAKYSKENSSYNRSKKEQSDVKKMKSKPTPPQKHSINYDTEPGDVKFKGAVFKLWNTIKPGELKMSELTKDFLGRFTCELCVSLIKALKVHLEYAEMVTFKLAHVKCMLNSIATLNDVNINGLLKPFDVKVEKRKIEKKEDGPSADGPAKDGDKGKTVDNGKAKKKSVK